jgi:hypothetical protein
LPFVVQSNWVIVSFFHCFALLFVFVIKGIKRAFEFGEALRDEVKIDDCGFYG